MLLNGLSCWEVKLDADEFMPRVQVWCGLMLFSSLLDKPIHHIGFCLYSWYKLGFLSAIFIMYHRRGNDCCCNSFAIFAVTFQKWKIFLKYLFLDSNLSEKIPYSKLIATHICPENSKTFTMQLFSILLLICYFYFAVSHKL